VRLTGQATSGGDDEVGEFLAGLAEGMDPQPVADEPGPARQAVTRMSSPWANSDPCTTCGQTFRVGDRVVVDERGVGHLDPELGCAVERRGGSAGTERREFSGGLREAWPAAAGVDLVELTEDDWQVARPGPARKQRCIQCGDTFRAGEIVVSCPCHPGGSRDDPARCGQAVHRDPAAGLPCWEQWCPSGVVTLCPVSHTPLRQVAGVVEIRRMP
jgi:hypothetical protein